MGLTPREKRIRNVAESLRFGGIDARVSGNGIKVKTDRGLKLAKSSQIVKFNKIRVTKA